MPTPNFLNQNNNRDYPLTGVDPSIDFTGSGGFNTSRLVVDLGVHMGPASDWAYQTNDVRLTEVTLDLTGGTFIFEGNGIVFTITFLASPSYQTVYFEADLGAEFGFGFITLAPYQTTDPTIFLASLPSGLAFVDQALVQNASNLGVTSINIANAFSQQYIDTFCGIDPVPPPIPAEPYEIEVQGLTGDLLLDAGRFLQLNSSESTNELAYNTTTNILEGGVYPCDVDLRSFPLGYDPANEPTCFEGLFTINGEGPAPKTHAFTLSGSGGVNVKGDPFNPHGIIIEINSTLKNPADPSPPDCETLAVQLPHELCP